VHILQFLAYRAFQHETVSTDDRLAAQGADGQEPKEERKVKKPQYVVLVPFSTGYELRGGIFHSLKKAQKSADEWAQAVVVQTVSRKFQKNFFMICPEAL
jgi:hypothetical protein